MKSCTFIVIISCLCVFSASGQKIYDKEAARHIGETLEVIGTVNTINVVKHSRKALLFCGAFYPERFFTVIVQNRFKAPIKNPKGWNISVKGRIIQYHEMPAIKVPDWSAVQPVLLVDHVPNDI